MLSGDITGNERPVRGRLFEECHEKTEINFSGCNLVVLQPWHSHFIPPVVSVSRVETTSVDLTSWE